MRKAQQVVEDAIGVTRKHRWMPVGIQEDKLRADGVRTIVGLDKTTRDQIKRMVRERTILKVVYPFLLVDPRKRGAIRMLNDYAKWTEELANLPRGCHAYIKDVESGFLAETIPQRRVMLSVVREQCIKHHRGAKSLVNLPRGGQPLKLSDDQMRRAEAIWMNVGRYPTWDDAERALQEQVHESFTRWRANREFKHRPTRPK